MSNCANVNLDDLAEQFSALGNVNRLKLFLTLTSCCPDGFTMKADSGDGLFVGEISECCKIAPSTVSHHIKELRRVGLIEVERQGKNIKCKMNRESVRNLAMYLKDCCCPEQ